MAPRLQLQSLLEALTDHVYFQPPENLAIEYPCIVYGLDTGWTDFADDRPYRFTKRYQVTVIDRDPDSSIPDMVAALPMCVLTTAFVADNLHHTVFHIYF